MKRGFFVKGIGAIVAGMLLGHPAEAGDGNTGTTQATALGVAPSADAKPPSLVAAGAHHRVWGQVSSVTNAFGHIIQRTNGLYQEIATGLNYLSNGVWSASSEKVEITADGGRAVQGQHQVYFSADINASASAGNILQVTPEGKQLASRVFGLSYYDYASGKGILIAELTNSLGMVLPTGNQVLYPDAFTDFSASIRYTYTRMGLEQDIILNEQPPDLGSFASALNPDTTVLQVLTEFFAPPEMAVTQIQTADGRLAHHLDFGALQIDLGRAFTLGREENAVVVYPQWRTLGSRTFLVEEIPLISLREQLGQLPPPSPGHASITRPAASSLQALVQRQSPANRGTAKLNGTLKLANSTPSQSSLVLDYSSLINQTNTTLQSDTTYFVSGTVNLSGTTILEGAVLKYASNAVLNINGPLICKTAPYQPAIFVSQDDNTVGAYVSGSAPLLPTNRLARIALNLNNGSSNLLNCLRFVNAQSALCINGGSGHQFADIQIVNCQVGIGATNTDYYLRNALLANVQTNFAGLASTGRVEHLTSDTAIWLNDPNSTNLYLTNCLLVAVTNAGAYSSDHVFTTNTAANAFITLGTANHYLPALSPFLGLGTTNLSAPMRALLPTKTVFPPSVYGQTTITNNLTLTPQAARETLPPAPGYHYDPIDWAFGNAFVTNAAITVTAGTVMAGFGSNTVSGYGLGLCNDSPFICQGTPTNLNHIVSFDTVQEPGATNWVRLAFSPLMQSWNSTPSLASIYCRFTDFSVLGGPGNAQLYDMGGSNTIPVFQDCQFHGGSIYGWNLGATMTNCLLERVDSYLWGLGNTPNNLRNCTIFAGYFDFYLGLTNSACRDNLFDHTSIFDEGSATYLGGYNGYITNCDRLPTGSGSDVILSVSPLYAPGLLGRYYLPGGSALLNAGSTTADLVGLYSYTTATNQISETNSVVDIGYHYSTLDSYGAPMDTDGNGVPNFLQDAQGNGAAVGIIGSPDTVSQSDRLLLPGYLRCEYLENPLGVWTTNSAGVQSPRLFWTLDSNARGSFQRAYQIQVATTEANLTNNLPDMWDSGKVCSSLNAQVEYNGLGLAAGQRVWWRVRVWEQSYDLPSPWSTNAFWQMGLAIGTGLGNTWTGNWLNTASDPGANVSPMYRHLFLQDTNSAVKHATVYVTAKGVYELWLNGQRVGNNVLAPEWTDYKQRIQYQTFDVTALINTNNNGSNVIGAIVGEGWYSGGGGAISYDSYSPGHNDKQLLVQLVIDTTASSAPTRTVIQTDNTWKCNSSGPIQKASIYKGETYDATLESAVAGWSTAAYGGESTNFTTSVTTSNVVPSQLTPQPNEPIKINQTLNAVNMWTNSSGANVVRTYDFGQNIAGWCSLHVSNLNSTNIAIITLKHAEIVQFNAASNFLPFVNGSIDQVNMGAAEPNDTFKIAASSVNDLQPHFTYHGFRFVEVTSPPGVPLYTNSIIACVVGSSPKVTGSFSCSDYTVSKLMTNILWTQKANLMGTSTDCPQRDERYGYLGDAQIFSETACYNMDMHSFLTKYIRDIRDGQLSNGCFPYYAPYNGRYTWLDIGWQSAGIILPWRLYIRSGDTRFLTEHYPSIKKWLNFLNGGSFSIAGDTGIGDWLSGGNFDRPPESWSNTTGAMASGAAYGLPFKAYSFDLGSSIATVLANQAQAARDYTLAASYTADATSFATSASNIRTYYLGGSGPLTYAGGNITAIGGNGSSQSDCVAALYFGMIPPAQQNNVINLLINGANGIANYNNGVSSLFPDYRTNHLSTGIQFSGRALSVLSSNGNINLAYRLLLDHRFPSWGYNTLVGSSNIFQETTISEWWNNYVTVADGGCNHKSFNHYAFGAVGEWIYRTVGGINPDESEGGFRNVIINIQPDSTGVITNAYTRYVGMQGEIMTAWTNYTADSTFSLTLYVPKNSTATLTLPAEWSRITEGGKAISSDSGRAVLPGFLSNFHPFPVGPTTMRLGGGKYHFFIGPPAS